MVSYIGIDLGTTYSAIATIDSTGRPIIVHDSDGNNIIPSCVSEKSNGEFEVGEEARRTWGIAPGQAAARFKREMGTDTPQHINSKEYSPEKLSSIVLKKLKDEAERSIGKIGEAVVTIPANFSNDAREATMSAAKAAGLNVKYIINEPTAAALFYAFKNDEDLFGKYAVYDMGGGTFDVSIIDVKGQDVEVLASNGVSKLGGDDFDQAIRKLVQSKYKELTGEVLEDEDFSLNDAEEEKKSLSKRDRVKLRVNRNMLEINREEFEEAISTLVAQAEMLCESTIDEAGIDVSEIKSVFLAGGSTRIPLIKQSVKRVFDIEPDSSANVDEIVALGAALYAAYKSDRKNLSEAQKNTIQKIKVSESTNKCFGTIAITHDENRNQAKLSNSILIKKGKKIPCSVTNSFYTTYEGQTEVTCKITESISPETDPRFVKIIDELELVLPEGRQEGREIKVTYSYDENQIMHCIVLDVESGNKVEHDISMTSENESETSSIDKFLVE